MEHIVFVEFNKSRSKLYNHAIALASKFSSYKTINDHTECSINTVVDYIKNQEKVEELIQIVSKWSGAKILLYGNEYRSNLDLYEFNKGIKDKAGKYAVMLNLRGSTKVALGCITYEQLPKPFVYYPNLYGAFFAFSDDIGDELYFCECERKAIENYMHTI